MDISSYAVFDMPVPYKGLMIYPAKIKDYGKFMAYSECLKIEKNLIPDPDIIRMTELEYIFYISGENESKEMPPLFLFDRLLSLLLNDNSFDSIKESIYRYNIDESGKPFFTIENQRYYSEDFDAIKTIICDQNLIELPDENISKEVRDSLEKARRYKQKRSGAKPASLEEIIVSLSMASGWELEYIYKMTIRKFIKALEKIDSLIHYKIYLMASMSGFVEFKDKSFIKHWLSGSGEKDRYEDVSVDYDSLKKTISTEGAKEKEASKYKK